MKTVADAVQALDLRTLPIDTRRAVLHLALDVVLFFACAWAVIATDHALLGAAPSFALGVVVYRLFVIKHDCGHRGFARTVRGNDVAGTFAGLFAFFPFHAWRHIHDQHHRHTHLHRHDGALEPMTPAEYAKAPLGQKIFYQITRRYWPGLAATGFVVFALVGSLSGHVARLCPQADRRAVLRSGLLAWAALLGATALVYTNWGFYGVFYVLIVPQLLCHQLFTMTSLIHHTAPDNCFRDESAWTAAVARFELTFHVPLPRALHTLSHNIFWHVPHHLCPAIPHYRLEEAHRRLVAAYPGLIRERRLTLESVRSITRDCHLIDTDGASPRWVRFEELTHALPATAAL